jgi:hypothetical protein
VLLNSVFIELDLANYHATRFSMETSNLPGRLEDDFVPELDYFGSSMSEQMRNQACERHSAAKRAYESGLQRTLC